jgi:hypothetical protein
VNFEFRNLEVIPEHFQDGMCVIIITIITLLCGFNLCLSLVLKEARVDHSFSASANDDPDHWLGDLINRGKVNLQRHLQKLYQEW